jgi:hypothetical protein
MSRTNFNFGGWPRILSWTACPFSVGSCLCPQVAHSFCLSAHFALWFPWVFLLLQLQSAARVALPETLSLLRFAWLADWVAVRQPGFYWRLRAYSYLRSCEGAYSEARSSIGITLGTQGTLILSLDLLQFRFQQLQAAPIGDSETASRAVSRPPAHSPSTHRTVLLASTTSTLPPRSFWPASIEPAPAGSPSPAGEHNSLRMGPGGFHPLQHS